MMSFSKPNSQPQLWVTIRTTCSNKNEICILSEIQLCNLYDPHNTETSFPISFNMSLQRKQCIMWDGNCSSAPIYNSDKRQSTKKNSMCSCRVSVHTRVITRAVLYIRIATFTISAKLTKFRGLSPHANYTDRAAAALSAKLVPTFADRGVSRGQRNGSPQPLISVF